MAVNEARKHITLARRQLEWVQRAAARDHDPGNAVTWAFYAYENCVTALAEFHGRSWEKNHSKKAQLARSLHNDRLISRNVGDELEELNRLRKDVAYVGPGPELQEVDLDDLAYELEEFICEIESGIGSST